MQETSIAPTPTSTELLDSLISPETLAERLGVKVTTLAEWRVNGKGPSYLRIGRSARYVPDYVDEWLLAQRCSSTAEEVRS